jgi:NAD(P)-dependent dehydrogenase (short-subunit alcohol dehydrogenase family)
MLRHQAATYGAGDPDGYYARLRAIYPQGANARFATPEEIGRFVFAIASPQLAPLTGAALAIDFGTTAGR